MTTKYKQMGAEAAAEDGRAGSAGADLDVEALLQHLGLDSGGAEEAGTAAIPASRTPAMRSRGATAPR